MDKKPNEIHENLIPTKLTNIQYSINSYTTINTPYNWPAFLSSFLFKYRVPYSAKLWQGKTLANSAKCTSFANILPSQIPDY